MSQPALFPAEVMPQRPAPTIRLVPDSVFLSWYRRTFGVDLSQGLVNLRTTLETVDSQPRLRLERSGAVRRGVAQFTLRVGSFGCVLPWLREE